MIIYQYNLESFIRDFLPRRNDFSREGLALLFEHYNQIGHLVAFDYIGACGEWGEYSDPLEALKDVGGLDEFENLEAFYLTLTYEGKPPDEALKEVLGKSVLWDGFNCFLVGA